MPLIFRVKPTYSVLALVCKALLISVSPGFVGRICAVSEVDGPIIATDAILKFASSYSMVARPDDVRASPEALQEKYLRSSFPVAVEMAENRGGRSCPEVVARCRRPNRHYLLTMRPLFLLFPEQQKSPHVAAPSLTG